MHTTRFRISEPAAVLLALGIIAFLQVYLIVAYPGTYDAGDSVAHYLFAHHAFAHPENLLHHWAKPFFTLVAAPFAAMGFGGMKVFQCLVGLGTGWLVYRMAVLAGLRHAWAAPLFLMAAPEYFLSLFSGLTEPLYGFMLVGGIYLIWKERPGMGAVVLSFLPLVRTEGFLLLPVFGIYLLAQRDWRSFLLLGCGTAVYSLIGGIVYGDVAWLFTQNPYAGPMDNYGKGDWGHYVEQHLFVVGVPLYVLTALGLILAIWRFITKENRRWVLVVAPFLVYFISHMVFWATGTAHSLGMVRVMVAIVPLGILIALDGMWIFGFFGTGKTVLYRVGQVLVGLTVVYILLFPLSGNHASIHFPKDFELTADQTALQKILPVLPPNQKLYYSHPSFPYLADIDPFDSTQVGSLTALGPGVPKGSILVWDAWFSAKEDGVYESFWVEFGAHYHRIGTAVATDPRDGRILGEVRVYEKL